MPPTPQPRTPTPLTMGVWESVPDHGVGKGGADPVDLADGHRLGQVLQVHLVDDAHPGRHHAEAVERLLSPAEQGVALVVALVLALDVASVGVGAAEGVDLHRVVDDQVDRDQRVDAAGVAPAALHGAPHRGQVDDRGDTGEVLEQHPGRDEGALAVVLGQAGRPSPRGRPRRRRSRSGRRRDEAGSPAGSSRSSAAARRRRRRAARGRPAGSRPAPPGSSERVPKRSSAMVISPPLRPLPASIVPRAAVGPAVAWATGAVPDVII